MSQAVKIDNPELVRLLAASKVNVCKMAIRLLEDIDEISQKPKSTWDEDQIRQLNALKGIFTMVTGFISRTTELSEGGDYPEVSGVRDMKGNKKNSIGNFKLPPPPDAMEA